MDISDIEEIAQANNALISFSAEGIDFDYSAGLNSCLLMPSASVIKTAIFWACLDLAKNGFLDLDSEVFVDRNCVVGGAGVIRHLNLPKKYAIRELLFLMMSVSDNTAANLIIEVVGMDKINECLICKGYESIKLKRKFLDYQTLERGCDNLCSSSDMAKLLKNVALGCAIGDSNSQAIMHALSYCQNKDRLASCLPNDVDIANKTGASDKILNESAIIKSKNRSVSLCVLTQGFEDRRTAYFVIRAIVGRIYENAFFDERRGMFARDYLI